MVYLELENVHQILPSVYIIIFLNICFIIRQNKIVKFEEDFSDSSDSIFLSLIFPLFLLHPRLLNLPNRFSSINVLWIILIYKTLSYSSVLQYDRFRRV